MALRRPMARHQLQEAKLSFDDGNLFHLFTMGKRVLVPQTLVTSIVAMYHESAFYGHSGVLRTMSLIKRDYVCSDLRHYVECYILSCDVPQAAEWGSSPCRLTSRHPPPHTSRTTPSLTTSSIDQRMGTAYNKF